MKTIYFRPFGDVPITLDDDCVHGVFTSGYCGALAKALNHIEGCKIIMTWGHAAVMIFDGQVLDIKGVHDLDKFEKEWGEVESCNDRTHTENFYNMKHWKKALPFANLLIKKYLH